MSFSKTLHGRGPAVAFAILTALSVLLMPSMAQAATYYVATTGNNSNPGTQSQPWRTIQNAASRMVGGDTVFVRGGVYAEAVNITFSGTSAARITYRNFPGEVPIVDGTGISIPADLPLVRFQASWITWDGIDVRDSQRNGIGANGTNVTGLEILNSEIYNNGSISGTQDGGILFFLVSS